MVWRAIRFKAKGPKGEEQTAVLSAGPRKYGMHLLHEPSVSPDFVVDIVAVHGLGGRPYETWTHRDSDKIWLRDFLPAQLKGEGREPRVMTFGYDADLRSRNVLDIRGIAENLLAGLRDRRRGVDPTRPIVFVGHSMGGLVIKNVRADALPQLRAGRLLIARIAKALLIASETGDAIAGATYGVMFMAVPHRGTPSADYATIMANIANLFTPLSASAVRQLRRDSADLVDLSLRFSNLQESLMFVSVLEAESTKLASWLGRGSIWVVPPESGRMILGGQRQQTFSISGADHHTVCKFKSVEDAQYLQVAGALEDLVSQALDRRQQRLAPMKALTPAVSSVPVSQKPLQLWPFPRNDGLVFRKNLFTQLEDLLPHGPQYQEAALWGLGGSGKTQIALEFAYRRQRQTSCSSFWVHVDNVAQFTDDYIIIARLAGLSLEMKGDEMFMSVRRWLEQQHNYLLVLDNADNLGLFKPHDEPGISRADDADLSCFLPRGSTGTILWTSRDQRVVGSLVGVRRGVQVQAMTGPEALTLFRTLTASTTTTEKTAEEHDLLTALDYLPLAIAQAAAYIRTTKFRTEVYVKRLGSDDDSSKLLDKGFADRHRRSDIPNSLMRTWLVSMEQISKDNACASSILRTIIFFDRQKIPFTLLQEAAGPKSDRDTVLQAATRLQEFSFLSIQSLEGEEFPGYEIHPLVQKATQLSIDGPARDKQINAAAQIIGKVFPSGSYGTWDKCQLYLPHALKSLAWLKREEEKLGHLYLLVRVARYLFEQGRSKEAEALEVQVLELRKDVLGEKHPNTLSSMANLASTYRQQGRSKEAEALEVQVLELRKDVLGEKHPNTLSSMGSLASTYWQQGRSKEAEALEVQVLELRKDVLGEKHPDTLRSMANLAATYRQQGRSKEAEALELRVLEQRKDVLGERHPDTLSSMGSLASTYWQQGRSKEAEALEVQVLELRKDVLGEKHPDTLRSMANLAATYRQQGRSKEAEALEVQVLELRKDVLGERHPDTLRSMGSLASTYWQQGRSKEAEALDVQVLELNRDVLGEKHPDTLNSMGSLAATYWQQGRSKEAESLQVQVLELNRDVLGERHPDTLSSMAGLAATYWQQGRSKEAEALEVQVLELNRDVLGEKHPDTLSSMAGLAATYWQQGRSKEAEALDVQVLELNRDVLGEKHPDTLNSMASLAATYWQQGRSKEAEALQVQVLELNRDVLGEKHPDTLSSMASLAATYWQQGRSKEAEELQAQVLELRRDVLGEKHPDTLSSMASLAVTYWQQGRSKEAEALQVQVLELNRDVLGEKHPDTLRSMGSLASTYGQQGRSKEAEALEVQVLELSRDVLGERHPDTLSSMASLASTYRQQGRSKEAEALEV